MSIKERFAEWWDEWHPLAIFVSIVFVVIFAGSYALINYLNESYAAREKAYHDCIHDGARWVQISRDQFVCDRSQVE